MPKKTSEKISNQINVHALPALELKAYWALDKLSTSTNDRFTAPEVANYLIETAGVPTSQQAIRYALNKNTKACHKNKHGYKLMHDGKTMLQKHYDLEKVVFIDGNKPFTAKNHTLKDIFKGNYKEIALCDPYIDLNTLDILFNIFSKGTYIRVLTANIIDKPTGSFKRQLQELNNEGLVVEVKKYTSSGLHDRYIISEKSLWFSGNSINHLGKKESFLILLGSDIRQSVLSTFNSRWTTAQSI